MHARLVLPVHNTLQMAAAFGVALLGGCVGAPQTFHVARPVVPGRPAALRTVPRPPPPALSASEKRRLFREFQQSQGTDQAATDQGVAP